MADGIMILGAPGAGKTTLGGIVAQRLGCTFIDIDEYIWRKDTEQPYTAMYSREEKIARVAAAVPADGRFVMAGSMNSFHEHFDHLFRLAVFLDADCALRVRRAHERAVLRFGERVAEGGDLYEHHLGFLDAVAGYSENRGGMTLQGHAQWLAALTCPILRLDGGDALEKNAEIIITAYCAEE